MYCISLLHLNVVCCSPRSEYSFAPMITNQSRLLIDRNDKSKVLGQFGRDTKNGLFKVRFGTPKKPLGITEKLSAYINNISSQKHSSGLGHERIITIVEQPMTKMMRCRSYSMSKADKLGEKELTVCAYINQTRKRITDNLKTAFTDTVMHANIYGLFKSPALGGNRYFSAMTTIPHRFCAVEGHIMRNNIK